ncbi:MAG: TetR/AcrR family transcriptional regulator [Henriciella sp.]
MKAAEKRVRAAGFTEMSFRDVANDVGIKSASVHYHFPTKADLGEALVEGYASRFEQRLNEIDKTNLLGALSDFIGLYDEALVLNEAICLCAVLGAEAIGLPDTVTDRTRRFFAMNLDWLGDLFAAYGIKDEVALASVIVTALEGAMIVASTSQDRHIFDQVSRKLSELVVSKAHN